MEKETTERGFRIFGRIQVERYSAELRVQESSLACEGPHVWLFCHAGEEDVTPQLNVEQAEKLISALQDFVAEAKTGELAEAIASD